MTVTTEIGVLAGVVGPGNLRTTVKCGVRVQAIAGLHAKRHGLMAIIHKISGLIIMAAPASRIPLQERSSMFWGQLLRGYGVRCSTIRLIRQTGKFVCGVAKERDHVMGAASEKRGSSIPFIRCDQFTCQGGLLTICREGEVRVNFYPEPSERR